MKCPILKRPADCTRPGPSRLSFTQKPRPKQCVGELEIPGLPSTARTLFSGLRVSTRGKQAGPLVGFYHSAGRQPANSTPRPAGGFDSFNAYSSYSGDDRSHYEDLYRTDAGKHDQTSFRFKFEAKRVN